MKKVGSRGFSLIELLAVVVILGVLSGVGIGAYSRIVTKSKLEAYLDVVKLQAKEASKLVNAGDYYADDDNTVYYFDYKIFDDDKSMQSPFGKWIDAYVAVVFDGDKYYYYWTGVDDAGYTSITLPNLSETDGLTIETNAFSHNSIPLSSDSRWVYRIKNGKYDYSVLDSYAGVKPGGTLSIPEKSHNVNLTHIYATFQWQSYSTIVIPKYVTTIGNGVLGKSNNNNVNFTKVINKTGRSFDWYNITSSNHTNTGNFTTGVVSHQSGNITIDDK